MRAARLFLIFIAIFWGSGAFAAKDDPKCSRELSPQAQATSKTRSQKSLFVVVAEDEVAYEPESEFDKFYLKDRTRFQSAYMIVQDPAMVREIAQRVAFAQSAESIERVINSYLDRGIRKIPLRELFGRLANSLTNTCPTEDGPNCFNATRIWHDVNETVAQEPYFSMSWWLDNRATLQADKTPLLYGDIIEFYNDKLGRVLHTVVYLGEGIIWHKESKTATTPWTFSHLKPTAQFYTQLNEVLVRHYRISREP